MPGRGKEATSVAGTGTRSRLLLDAVIVSIWVSVVSPVLQLPPALVMPPGMLG